MELVNSVYLLCHVIILLNLYVDCFPMVYGLWCLYVMFYFALIVVIPHITTKLSISVSRDSWLNTLLR